MKFVQCNCTAADKRALVMRDRKGGDPAEWPEDLRVQQFPAAPTAATVAA